MRKTKLKPSLERGSVVDHGWIDEDNLRSNIFVLVNSKRVQSGLTHLSLDASDDEPASSCNPSGLIDLLANNS